MRILHVVSTVARKYGGPSVAVRGMVEGLVELGHDVTITTTSTGDTDDVRPTDGAPRTTWGASMWVFSRTLPGEWHFSMPMGRWIHAHAREFDIVHEHGIFSYHTLPTGRATRGARVPLVMRPLGMLSPYSRAQRSWKKKPYFRLIERRNLDGAAAIHVTSQFEREGVAALGYGAKAHVIPLGVDVPAVSQRARRDGPLQLLLLARLHPGKGIELAIDAIALLQREAAGDPGVRLNIVGSTNDPAYKRSLRDRVASAAVEGLVTFSGHLDGEAKAAAYSDADVFVLPSAHENFGIAVAEALAAGLPVIVAPDVGLAADVRRADAGRVVAREPAAIVAAIRELHNDESARLAMGERARALTVASYSWRSCATHLVALYESLRGARAHGSVADTFATAAPRAV